MNMKEYLKKNKSYLMIMCIGVCLYAFQLRFVVLYADDFTSKIADTSHWISEIFNRCYTYYFNWRRCNMLLDTVFRNV